MQLLQFERMRAAAPTEALASKFQSHHHRKIKRLPCEQRHVSQGMQAGT